jgi:hypothetical protein
VPPRSEPIELSVDPFAAAARDERDAGTETYDAVPAGNDLPRRSNGCGIDQCARPFNE